MRGDEVARTDEARQIQGDNLAKAFPPDWSADADVDSLIEQLGSLAWPKFQTKETQQ